MHNITLLAPAKLNLFLHVLGQRPDGYHNIQTVFQFIDFCDELTVLVRDDGIIKVSPELFGIPASENLIVRAAHLLKEYTNCEKGADIFLTKNIPMGAGLGGGSSDAAVTLSALNVLWGTGLDIDELSALGSKLGADVPVFIHGHAAWAEGIGDELTPIILPESWYVLVLPHCRVSTPQLYQDPRLTRDSVALTIGTYQPGQGHNDFTPIVKADYPEVAQALEWLSQYAPARMTGSGGACFARFDTQAEASKIAALAPESLKVILVKGLNHSPMQIALANT